MKRIFILVTLVITFSTSFSQWNANFEPQLSCSHVKSQPAFFSPDQIYDWQTELLNNYDVTFYWLDIEVSNTSTFVSGNSTMVAEAIVTVDTFAFELVPDINIDSIKINHTKYTNWIRQGDEVLVPVTPISQGSSITAQVFYNGDPGSVGFLSGLSHDYSETYQKHVVWSLSEPFGAKSWFPVKQDLEDKADSCWVFLTTSSSNMAGSEGLLTNTVNLGNGKTRYEWKSSYPIDYYLISFAVSEYQEYNIYAHPDDMNGDSLLIQNLIYDAPNCLENNKAGIDATAEMIEVYSDLFSLYPFDQEKYGHCLTELLGGMEHQTMTTLGGFSFGLVAHELGHMWFGDNITCATWSDIWINEGFATYANCLAEEFIHGWESGKSFIKNAQDNVMTQPGGSTYIPEDQISEENQWRIFNGRLSYNKGAVILHTLRHEIQDDSLFFNVLQTYQQEFGDSTATGEDFKNVAEDVTGMDFDQFFEQWYYGQGYPTYDIEFYMEGQNLNMTVTQSASTTATPFFEMLMDYKLLFEDGSDTTVHLQQTDNINNFLVNTGGKEVTDIVVDPEEWTMEKVDNISVTVEETESPVYFSIGPNPVADKLNIYLLNDSFTPKTITISDLSGKQVDRFVSNSKRITYDASGLQHGVYFIELSDGGNHTIRKFIK